MGRQLIRQSFAILLHDKKLIVFPILSVLAAAAVSAPFLFHEWLGITFPAGALWGVLGFVVWYTAAFCAMNFFNCALAACAEMHFSGGRPTVAGGIRRAAERFGSILWWSLIACTVGLIFNAIEENVKWIPRMVPRVLGIGWTMATYLMVPVLVLEDQGVTASVKRSATLLRGTWGDQLLADIRFGWLTVLVAIPGVVLGVVAMNYYSWLIPLVVLYFVLALAAFSAVQDIFVVALYRYANGAGESAGVSLPVPQTV